MSSELKNIECDPKCGFIVQSHDEREVPDIAKIHAKEQHYMNATEQQLRAMMKSA